MKFTDNTEFLRRCKDCKVLDARYDLEENGRSDKLSAYFTGQENYLQEIDGFLFCRKHYNDRKKSPCGNCIDYQKIAEGWHRACYNKREECAILRQEKDKMELNNKALIEKIERLQNKLSEKNGFIVTQYKQRCDLEEELSKYKIYCGIFKEENKQFRKARNSALGDDPSIIEMRYSKEQICIAEIQKLIKELKAQNDAS